MADRNAGGAAVSSGVIELIDKQRRSLRLIRLGEAAERASHPPRKGPPSVVFRDAASGLLRVVDREMVLRFRSSAPEVRRRAILRDQGLVVRRINPFIPDQVVVFQPEGQSPAVELDGAEGSVGEDGGQDRRGLRRPMPQ